MPINPAMLLSSGAPVGMPLPAPGPGNVSVPTPPNLMNTPPPMPMGPPPGAGLNSMNSAALLGLQGAPKDIPPNWKIDTQADGTLLLKDVQPDGTEIIRKVLTAPKKAKPGQ